MNRYPLWKYIIVAIALVLGFVYTLPNFFGESPAVQLSSAKVTIKVDDKAKNRVEETLKSAGITHDGIQLDFNGVKTRLKDTDTQLKAKDILEKAFNPDPADPQYVVALNLLSASPQWLTSLHALPMYLGLDLRGGVHFLLQVDMKGALTKRLDSISADLRTVMRDKNLRHGGVGREGDRLVVRFRDVETRDKARNAISDSQPDLIIADQGEENQAHHRAGAEQCNGDPVVQQAGQVECHHSASSSVRSRPKYSARGRKCGRIPLDLKVPFSRPSESSPSN